MTASRRSLNAISLLRSSVLALSLALGASAAHAANKADWWVYVANDNADDVKSLLVQGVDPNVRYKNGQPAIMRAVSDGAWHVFDLLAADKRTDLNAANPADETPLMYLALAGQIDRARALIAKGAQVNRLGWTPLHYAASKGQLDMARLLLKSGAMVNAPSPGGVTPLMMAGYSKSRDMVQLLLAAGADPAAQDAKGQNAADWAVEGKANNLAKELSALITQVESSRDARRAARPADSDPDVPDANASAEPAKALSLDAVNKKAPAPAAAPAAASSSKPGSAGGVKGVSGVGLTDYSKPTSP